MHHFPKWCIIAPSFRGEFSSLSLWKPNLQAEYPKVRNQPYRLCHRRHKSERARLVLIFPHMESRQREDTRLVHVKTSRQKSRRARRALILAQAFLSFLLSGLLVRIELSGNNGGMALYPDFPLLLAAFCVPVAFIGEEEAEPLPLKTDKTLLLYFQRNHVPGFRVEPFYP